MRTQQRGDQEERPYASIAEPKEERKVSAGRRRRQEEVRGRQIFEKSAQEKRASTPSGSQLTERELAQEGARQ